MEIKRTTKSIKDHPTLKASELRSFLYYIGISTVYDILPTEYFEHFICLVVAIRLLTQNKVSFKDIASASTLLNFFVMRFEKLYGLDHMTFKLHALTHLPFQVLYFGPLHKHSAYHFEGAIIIILNQKSCSIIRYFKIYKGFFHIMNSYIHGTRGFVNQIFINHRIGSFIESNKTEILNSLQDLQMRSLLSKMADIHHENSNSHSFTRGFVSDLKSPEHKSILVGYGLTPDSLNEWSDFSRIRNTGKNIR